MRWRVARLNIEEVNKYKFPQLTKYINYQILFERF